jgi:hypothetical protein
MSGGMFDIGSGFLLCFGGARGRAVFIMSGFFLQGYNGDMFVVPNSVSKVSRLGNRSTSPLAPFPDPFRWSLPK